MNFRKLLCNRLFPQITVSNQCKRVNSLHGSFLPRVLFKEQLTLAYVKTDSVAKKTDAQEHAH